MMKRFVLDQLKILSLEGLVSLGKSTSLFPPSPPPSNLKFGYRLLSEIRWRLHHIATGHLCLAGDVQAQP